MLNRRRNIVTVMILLANVFFAVHLYSQEIHAVIEITGVTAGGGSVYVGVFSNEQAYAENRRFVDFIIEPAQTTLLQELNLPAGEYVVAAYQDKNNNGKLDTGLFGIPTESFGFTNYNRGIPGNFQKLKVPVNASQTRITVNIGRYRM